VRIPPDRGATYPPSGGISTRFTTGYAADDPRTNPAPATVRIIKQGHSCYWEVRDPQNEMVCITVFKQGAAEVARRLAV